MVRLCAGARAAHRPRSALPDGAPAAAFAGPVDRSAPARGRRVDGGAGACPAGLSRAARDRSHRRPHRLGEIAARALVSPDQRPERGALRGAGPHQRPRRAADGGAVRLAQGRLHRGPTRQPRGAGTRGRRDALHRRGGQALAASAGRVAARARRARVPCARRHGRRAARGRALHRRHQREPSGGGAQQATARGSLLPHQRPPRAGPRIVRAQGRDRAVGCLHGAAPPRGERPRRPRGFRRPRGPPSSSASRGPATCDSSTTSCVGPTRWRSRSSAVYRNAR